VAIHDPAEHAAALLARLLAERGVKLMGDCAGHAYSGCGRSGSARVLASSVGASWRFRELVNKDQSGNLHTEMLLRAALEIRGCGTRLTILMKFPADFYTRGGIAAGDVNPDGWVWSFEARAWYTRAIVALLKYRRGSLGCNVFCIVPVAGIMGARTLMKEHA